MRVVRGAVSHANSQIIVHALTLNATAAMWDSHFRVGGATGTNLQEKDCPVGGSVNKNCMAASMLMHVTSKSSGYFENVWAWVADVRLLGLGETQHLPNVILSTTWTIQIGRAHV